MRIIAYGGGVQSTAMLVLATQGRISDVDAALFCNVGEDSEHPATLDYVRSIAVPWAAERGLTVHELQRTRRDGSVETLRGRITRDGGKSIAIPVRLASGAPASRTCTADFKVRVMARWSKQHGASADNPVTKFVGISTDEWHRANNGRAEKFERIEYPLLDMRMSRADCAQLIRDVGLPVPPKSSCYFCPWHSLRTWSEMRRDEPDLFERSAQLEDHLNARQAVYGRKPVFLTDRLVPLREAIAEAQTPLFGQNWLDESGECDSGACFT